MLQMKTPPDLLRFTRDKLRSSVHAAAEIPERASALIYVRRTASEARFVNNDQDVVDCLNRTAGLLGRRLVVFHGGQYSFREASRLFSQADSVVVGPHGAGLSNLMFSPSGTGVVEFALPEPEVRVIRSMR